MMATMNDDGENGRSLPDGWEWSTVANSVKNISLTGKKLPQRDYLETGKIPVIDQGQEFIGGYTNQNDLVVNCEPPVVIFGDHTKAIKFVTFPFVAGADGVKVLKPLEHFNPKLFYYFLQAVELPDKGYARHFQYLEKVEIPVPPLPEQERIVNRIEELLSDLGAGVSALERAQIGLQRYRASVLKVAVEGKLFESSEVKSNDELPKGWRLVDFIEIMKSLKNGFFYGRPATEPPGIPILRISAVRPLSVNLDEPRFIPDVDEDKVKAYFLEKGDLLFTRYNGNVGLVGACGRVRELPKPTIYPDKLIRVKVDQDVVLPEYLEIYFATQTARKFVEGRIKSTAGQHGIAGGDLKSIPVTLPPLDEQRRIVAEVERRLSVVGEVESAVEVGLVRAGRLRQSVLRSAFEGRLV